MTARRYLKKSCFKLASDCPTKRYYPCLRLGIAQQGERLYLRRCINGHDNKRRPALQRTHAAATAGQAFGTPKGIDLSCHDRTRRVKVGSGRGGALGSRIRDGAGLHRMESRLSGERLAMEEGDDNSVRSTVKSSERLNWWPRGFGDEVTVCAPAGLARATHRPRLEATP